MASSSDSDSPDELPIPNQPQLSNHPHYLNIQKFFKYIKIGNQTATVLALACLKDQDFQTEETLPAIRDFGGLEILINLLETENNKCIMGALSILNELANTSDIQREITNLGAVQLLVKILKGPDHAVQSIATNIIYHVAKIKKARTIVRKFGGISVMVDLLDVKESLLNTPAVQLDFNDLKLLNVVRGCTKALWTLSQSNKVKEEIRNAGCIKLLPSLLASVHDDIVVYTMGIVEQLCTQIDYQIDIQTEGMMYYMVRYLPSENRILKKHCASAIYKCAECEITRKLVRENGGLDPLITLIRDEGNTADKELLAAVTGAIWKCATDPDNVRRLNELNTINILVQLLTDEDEEVLKNVAGALSACARFSQNRETILEAGGIEHLVNRLTLTNSALLENVTKVLGECAKEKACMAKIEELDGIRLIWSLLKNKNPAVQANAAWALVPCIKNSRNSADMVRSLVGGLELIVSLLKSDDNQVLASVCAALAQIAQDRENLAVITDHGVVSLLCRHVNTENDRLRRYLALAIAYCCELDANCFEFGKLGAVGPLVSYMTSKDEEVHKSTALALHKISQDPFNCVTLHQTQVVQYLLGTIASQDETLQNASAGCLSNIRKLALAADEFEM